MNNRTITILLIDDHQLIRESWNKVLSSDDRFQVIGSASKTDEGILLARQLKPMIVLMDINVLPLNGIDATKEIRKFLPATGIIGVSMHSLPVYVKKLIRAGANGYVTKNSSIEELTAAIVEVHAGRRYICKEVKSILCEQELEGKSRQNEINLLTPREAEIAQLIKTTLSSKEIGVMLGVSLKTVEAHRYNILKKLGLKNTIALVNFLNQYAF